MLVLLLVLDTNADSAPCPWLCFRAVHFFVSGDGEPICGQRWGGIEMRVAAEISPAMAPWVWGAGEGKDVRVMFI